VEVKNRPLRDKYVLIGFLLILLLNVIIGIVISTGVKDTVGLAEEFNACVDANSADQTKFDIEDVKSGQASAIASISAATASISMDGITSNVGLLIGLSIAVVAVAALWVFLLYRFTKLMVWGTLCFNIGLVVIVGAYFLVAINPGVGAVYLLMAALQGLFLYCFRNNINMAAGLLNLAMQALRDFPSLILAGILINVLVLVVYIVEMIFIISAMVTVSYSSQTGQALSELESPPFVMNVNGGSIQAGSNYCVAGRSGLATFGMYFCAILLLWVTATLEAIRMAIASAVFGIFYYFAPEDPDKPKNAVCLATTWAFTVQLGTHAISGMVLAIIDQLKRMAKSRSQGIVGAIIRVIVLCILSIIEQLSKFMVVVTGLTGLSFWDSAKRTLKIMKHVFVDGYITSKIAVRVLRLSGFVFAFVFGIIAWAGVDTKCFGELWFLIFLILVGIISPILGIVLAIILSSALAGFGGAFGGGGNGSTCGANNSNPLSGPLAGLFFGSIAHAVLLFMEQLILDLVDAAFMCFAIDTHNGIISPRGEVVHRFMGATFGDQLTDSAKAQPTVAAGAKGPTPDVMPPPVAGAAAVSTHKYNA